MTPTARTLEYLRDNGYLAGVVERRNWFAGPPAHRCPKCNKNKIGVTVDLFGWCDIIAVPCGKVNSLGVTADGQWSLVKVIGTIYVQTTTDSNHASRRKKVLASAEAKRVIEAGNAIWVVTWKQKGGKGGRWSARVEEITAKMFAESP